MIRTRRVPVVIGVTLFTVAVSGAALRPAPEHVVFPTPAPPTFDSGFEVSGAALFEERPGPVDLYGNEVSDAVATYRIDSGGAIYEEHTPDVELPRLAAPKS